MRAIREIPEISAGFEIVAGTARTIKLQDVVDLGVTPGAISLKNESLLSSSSILKSTVKRCKERVNGLEKSIQQGTVFSFRISFPEPAGESRIPIFRGEGKLVG